MKIPKSLSNLIDSFERLPGIGPKTAQRLGFYLLRVPQTDLDFFATSLSDLKKKTILCSICKNVSETNPCGICDDIKREKAVIMVIEEPMDILVFEKTGKFKGVYHVLHGVINPLENIGPDELYIEGLFERIRENVHEIKEVIIATNPTMEGEATAMYLAKKIKEEFPSNGKSIIVSRLGRGVPVGADLGYADEVTLSESLSGRRPI